MKSPAIIVRSADLGLFGSETVGASTPIAAELRAHFARGGSVDDAVWLVEMCERDGASAAPTRKALAVRGRGSRLSPDWQPSAVEISYALELGIPRSGVNIEIEKFRNYWIAKSGAGATKRDWSATWRNWTINALERGCYGYRRYAGPTSGALDTSRRATTGSDAVIAGVGAATDRRARERAAAGQHAKVQRNDGSASIDDLELFRKGPR
jgi:hypothetical protein